MKKRRIESLNQKDRDIFDKIMSSPILNKLYPFYKKNKSVLLYIFFGGLTTVVSIGSFACCNTFLSINELVSNVISWILAVTFAYITNKNWVFNSDAKGKALIKEIIAFFGGRISTLIMEEIILLVFVTWLKFNGLIIKTSAQVLVLIANYFISKILVFKEKNNDKDKR